MGAHKPSRPAASAWADWLAGCGAPRFLSGSARSCVPGLAVSAPHSSPAFMRLCGLCWQVGRRQRLHARTHASPFFVLASRACRRCNFHFLFLFVSVMLLESRNERTCSRLSKGESGFPPIFSLYAAFVIRIFFFFFAVAHKEWNANLLQTFH